MYISSRLVGSLLVLFVVFASSAPAVTNYVSLNGGNVSPYTNWADASTTIQPAINASADGDTVMVSNGTFNLTAIVTIDKAIIFRSLSGPTATFVNGGYPTYTNGCFLVTDAVYIDGFTITNGRTPQYGVGWAGYGGGLNLSANANGAVVTNCVIAGNYAACGGGIYSEADATFANCIISNNWTAPQQGGGIFFSKGKLLNSSIVRNTANGGNWANGGGICMSDSASVINCRIIGNCSDVLNGGGGGVIISGGIVSNCVIMNNSAPDTTGAGGKGGGIYMVPAIPSTTPTLIYNCLIASNSAVSAGGGIQFFDGGSQTNPSIYNCTIVNNYANDGGGIYLHAGTTNDGLFNLIVVSNTIASWHGTDPNLFILSAFDCWMVNSCTTLTPPGTGNITDPPKFTDYANNNYRLAKGSPCINTGLNQDWMTGAVDLDGYSRKDRFSGMVDMGCYEYLPSGTMFSGH